MLVPQPQPGSGSARSPAPLGSSISRFNVAQRDWVAFCRNYWLFHAQITCEGVLLLRRHTGLSWVGCARVVASCVFDFDGPPRHPLIRALAVSVIATLVLNI